MIDIKQLFDALDNDGKETMMRIADTWWNNKLQIDAIELTTSENTMLHDQKKSSRLSR